MMKRKALIPVGLLLALGIFFSFRLIADKHGIRYGEENSIEPFEAPADHTLTKNEAILATITKVIKEAHYSPKNINDDFSRRVFQLYMEISDYGKLFFTQKDVDEFNAYQLKIDDEINAGSTELYDLVSTRFKEHMKLADSFYNLALNKPFNFNEQDEIELDGKKLSWCKDVEELKTRWVRNMKYRTLSRFVELKDDQKAILEKKVKAATDTIKTDEQLEAEARNSVRRNMQNYFKRLNKISDNDRFAAYMNCICHVIDPHTDFFPPKDKKRFDEEMSGSFVGIGAALIDKDGSCKIERIITGSPCWKDGKLKAGDIIMKVAQGSEEPVDIANWDTDDIVSIIRGKINTEVRLTVKHVDGSVEVIPITRGKVEQESTFAKSVIIKDENNMKIGYILLPEFYADFEDRNGRHCSADMQKEIEKLKAEKVNGIIIDLRSNGGGSLTDVVDIGGMFIDKGPIVQVKSRNMMAEALNDINSGVLFDGPLAILITQGSASASEILAAAMQDYKRGIILGTTSYGKGTVQRVFPLENFYQGDATVLPFGSLKITLQKFYRINGGSTQLKGVTPDIILPDAYEGMDMGERKDSNSMAWDQIARADFKPYPVPLDFKTLVDASQKRVASNESFKLITQNAQKVKKQSEDNRYSLNLTKFQEQMKEAKDFSKKLEEAENSRKLLSVENLNVDLGSIKRDSSLVRQNEDWLKAIRKDPYVAEANNVLIDWNRALHTPASTVNTNKN